MAVEVGTRLGPYEVTAQIGKGGMGEVYRAHDTSLDRDVAIKVLPDAFATDPERLARFQREAKVLASLNHPNIAAIHGLEESGDSPALGLPRAGLGASFQVMVPSSARSRPVFVATPGGLHAKGHERSEEFDVHWCGVDCRAARRPSGAGG